MNTLMIAYLNGTIGTEYHSLASDAIKSAKDLIPHINVFPCDIIGIRIDFADDTVALWNNVQQSDCLR